MSFSQEMLDKYPSLKKVVEQGDDYIEPWSQWNDGREAQVLAYVKQRADFAEIQGNPLRVLAAMDDFSNMHDFLISIGVHKAGVLEALLAQEQPTPRVVVELGGYLGYSAIFFAYHLRRLAASADGGSSNAAPVHIWSLEFDPAFATLIREFVAIAGLTEYITVVAGSADASLRALKADGTLDKVDLLFLDHVEELYEQDFKVAEGLGLLKSGSVVLADNVLRPGAPQYRDFVRSHAGLKSHAIRGLIMPGDLEDEFEYSKVL